MVKIEPILQQDRKDCGPVCLRMLFLAHQVDIDLYELRDRCFTSKLGTSLFQLSKAGEYYGFSTSIDYLEDVRKLESIALPAIAFVNRNHFLIIEKVGKEKVHLVDPAAGRKTMSFAAFEEIWRNIELSEQTVGAILQIEPHKSVFTNDKKRTKAHVSLFQFFTKFKKYYLLIGLASLFTISLLFLLPLLTRLLYDKGLGNLNYSVVHLIIIGQLIIYVGIFVSNLSKSWFQLYVGNKISLVLVSDFFRNFLSLDFSFFKSRHIGDFINRFEDNNRIEQFTSKEIIAFLYAALLILVFTIVLSFFDPFILLIYLGFGLLYSINLIIFQSWIKNTDISIFNSNSALKNTIVNTYYAISDIKLFNLESSYLSTWRKQYLALIENKEKLFQLTSLQNFISILLQNVFTVSITFYLAIKVIEGEISFGYMIAFQVIMSLLISPFKTLLDFYKKFTVVKISHNRLNSLWNYNQRGTEKLSNTDSLDNSAKDIYLKNVKFWYNRGQRPAINIKHLTIRKGETTAIVGKSGSGKSTLLKLILGYYANYNGTIQYGHVNVKNVDPSVWLDNFSGIFQESRLFDDTVKYNIHLAKDEIADNDKIVEALKFSNVHKVVEQLPLLLDTPIGASGTDLSQGQKQRILIARALYNRKNVMFFDEAMTSLDKENREIITNNVIQKLDQTTKIIITHNVAQLAWVDKIYVLRDGYIVESGSFQELVEAKKYFYQMLG